MVCLFPLIFLAFGTLFCFRINRPYYFNLSGASALSGCSPCTGAHSRLRALLKTRHPAPAKVPTAPSRAAGSFRTSCRLLCRGSTAHFPCQPPQCPGPFYWSFPHRSLFGYCHRLLQPKSGTLHSFFLPFSVSRWFYPVSSTLCLPALLSCLSNLQILDSPSFGRSLRNIGTDQAKTSVELWRAEHGMTSRYMGWKWEKTTPLWLLGQPDSPLGKGSDGERFTANTPTPPMHFWGHQETRSLNSSVSCLQLPQGSLEAWLGQWFCSSCCLFPPQPGEDAQSVSAQPKNPDGSAAITDMIYPIPVHCQLPLRALSTPAVSVNSFLKGQTTKVLSSWSSENIPTTFLIYSLHSELAQMYMEREYATSLIWNEFGIHSMKKIHLHCMSCL